MSVCHKHCFFFLVSWWNRAISWPSSSPWQKLQNVVLRILICCHGNEIWTIFAKISNCFFFFVFWWNRAIFWPLVLRDPLYKTLFFDFWFRPPNPQNWLPKIWQKISHNSACMAHRPQMFAPNRGFSRMADSTEPWKMATTLALVAESKRLPACHSLLVYSL